MYRIYLVKVGETLNSIARKLNTTEEALRQLNGFTPMYEVTAGTSIVVPAKQGSAFDVYVVQKGDTISSISRKLNISIDELLRLNGLDSDDYIYPEEELLIPNEKMSFYITTDDDTLDIVARKLNTTPDKIIEQNETIYLLPEQVIVAEKVQV